MQQLKKDKIYAVAMSGGVDSSTTAAIIQKSGAKVFGVTMNIHENCDKAIEDASKICQKLGIEHFVLDAKDSFKKYIMETFVEYYANGLTPNPCAFCNRDIKLNLLLKFAKSHGADIMATGHYVNMSVVENNVIMKEADNPKKDQSYFLSLSSKENLKDIIFPLGHISSKDETRRLASEFGLHNFEKKDSQDICFIPDGDYKNFIRNFQTNLNLFSPGFIKLKSGEILGEHSGIIDYTIGQRKGLGISYKDPLYVLKLDSENNEIILGQKDDLDISEFKANQLNWIIDMPDSFEAFVKLRSLCQKSKALIQKDGDFIKVQLLEPAKTSVTPGQICALYNEQNIVIGAGIIIA